MEIVLLPAVIAIALGGVFFWWYASDEQIAKRRLKKAPTLSIADVAEGELVKIVGTLALENDQQLVAPLTGRVCAGFLVEVMSEKHTVRSDNWEKIIRTEEAVDFTVEDATGTAVVRGGGATLVVTRDGHLSSGPLRDAPERVEAFLARHGTSATVGGFNKLMRYVEGALEPGEEVAVLGVGKWELDPDPTKSEGYRDRAKRLVIYKDDDGTLVISDDPSALG